MPARVFQFICAGVTAAALLGAPSAFAQNSEREGGFSLRGAQITESMSLRAAPDILSLNAMGIDDAAADEAGAAELRPSSQPQSAPATLTASALPWYERFTSAPSPLYRGYSHTATGEEFRVSAGERWGFTLGLTERPRGSQFDAQDFSAGAFFEVNPRLRLGADVRFTNPEEDIFGEEVERRSPEIKFESAFRF
jgi:hypothetical protein